MFYPSVVTVLEEVVRLLLYLIYSRLADTHAGGLARWADVRFLFVCSLLGALSEVIKVNFNKNLVQSHCLSLPIREVKRVVVSDGLISNLISKMIYYVTASDIV